MRLGEQATASSEVQRNNGARQELQRVPQVLERGLRPQEKSYAPECESQCCNKRTHFELNCTSQFKSVTYEDQDRSKATRDSQSRR